MSAPRFEDGATLEEMREFAREYQDGNEESEDEPGEPKEEEDNYDYPLSRAD